MKMTYTEFFEGLRGETVAVCGIGRNNLPVIRQLLSYGPSERAGARSNGGGAPARGGRAVPRGRVSGPARRCAADSENPRDEALSAAV